MKSEEEHTHWKKIYMNRSGMLEMQRSGIALSENYLDCLPVDKTK